RVLLFTGHRIDAPERKQPRFPGAAEDFARDLIVGAVERERARVGGTMIAIAGGASGGDILFHEICRVRDVKSQMFIMGSRDAYVAASVQDAGPHWVERFDCLLATLPSRTLGNSQGSLDLPRWLRHAQQYSVWERSNRWMLHNALAYGARNVT